MQTFICTVCSHVYNPSIGEPDAGIVPGTAWQDVANDYRCPDCSVGKDQFEPQ